MAAVNSAKTHSSHCIPDLRSTFLSSAMFGSQLANLNSQPCGSKSGGHPDYDGDFRGVCSSSQMTRVGGSQACQKHKGNGSKKQKYDIPNMPVIAKPETAQYIASKRGVLSILVDSNNYLYGHSVTKKDRSYYKCRLSKNNKDVSMRCPGNAVVVGDMILFTTIHRHLPDPLETQV